MQCALSSANSRSGKEYRHKSTRSCGPHPPTTSNSCEHAPCTQSVEISCQPPWRTPFRLTPTIQAGNNFQNLARSPHANCYSGYRWQKTTVASARRAVLAAMLKSTSAVEAITSTLEKIVGKSLHAAPQANAPVLAWPVVCGSAVAERTRALDFSKGVLTVEVPDAGWRAELQRLTPQYLAVINRYAARSVNRIEFVVRGRMQNAEVRMQK